METVSTKLYTKLNFQFQNNNQKRIGRKNDASIVWQNVGSISVSVRDRLFFRSRFFRRQRFATNSVKLCPLGDSEPVFRFLGLAILLVEDLGGHVLLSRDEAGGEAERAGRVGMEEVEVRVALRVDHVVAKNGF
jgi:hypothetical protein